MSGILAIYHSDQRPIAPAEVAPVLKALAHRGPDGYRLVRGPFAALGHLHLWATPEEVGERQPLAGVGGCRLSFDGRLDNRDELERELGRSSAPSPLSDAALVLRAWERWGEGCFERLLGPYAALIVDPLRRRLVGARDPLGGRSLYYHSAPRLFVAATEENAVLAHPAVPAEPDRQRLAEHLALRVPDDGSTFWRAVRELRPGHLLSVDGEGLRQRRFDEVRPAALPARLSDAECAERFGELLEHSVVSRLRAPGPPAVLMSGGLDSTAVAALAARRLAASGESAATPISWIFDELAACDERRFILPVCRRIGATPVLIQSDGSWPLRRIDTWMAEPDGPEESPYRLLKSAAYRAAAARGGRVLLTGGFGDHLWTGAAWWLRDLLRAGRPLEAAGELLRALVGHPERALGGLRRALALPPLRRSSPPVWLTPAARRRLGLEDGHRRRPGDRLEEAARVVLGAPAARSATLELGQASRVGIELRHPYRDRRLVEFVLGLPAHQLYRRRRKKHLLRGALAGLLPTAVLSRRGSTGLTPLYRRGVAEREARTVDELLATAEPLWTGIVEPRWLAVAGRTRSSAEELVVWHCLMLELWRRRLAAARRPELWRAA